MRLIDADFVKQRIQETMNPNYVYSIVSIQNLIYEAPTIEAEPVRHGEWLENDNGTYSCSKCKSWIPKEQQYYARYCLYCGARMDEVKDNE